MEKHSELPWIIDPDESMPLAVIQDNADGMGVCEIGERNEENLANAALIVRCVNAHDDLVKALEMALNETEPISKKTKLRPGDGCTEIIEVTEWPDWMDSARAALAKARADQRK